MRRKKRSSLDATANAGELFICFTSRPSSAAAKRSSGAGTGGGANASKSLLSPGRGRDAAAPPSAPSLSASLSRRLKNSGSVKGAQSPMFPAGGGGAGRRKGVAFEAAEPSSPKVTCIGQVRVKSKKKKAAAAAAAAARAKGAAFRSRSMRGSRGEASFRRAEELDDERLYLSSNKNQNWVYQLPVSICEALRTFGSEINCFFPCGMRSMCGSSSSTDAESRGVERRGERGDQSTSSCAAVLARWLMAEHENDCMKTGEVVSLVMDEGIERRGEREMEVMIKERMNNESLELEVEVAKRDEILMVSSDDVKEEEEEARISICIPPPNALLLMRCRSDPVRMAALASRFWDSPAVNARVEEEVVGEDEEDEQDDVTEELMKEYVRARVVRAENDENEVGDVSMRGTEEFDRTEGGIQEGSGVVNGLSGEIDGVLKEEGDSAIEEKEDEGLAVAEGSFVDSVEVRRMSVSEEIGDEATVVNIVENAELKKKPKEIRNDISLLDKGGGEEEVVMKGRRSSSCSSTDIKEGRRSFKWHSKLRESGRRRNLSSKDKDRRRHSFSVEKDLRRSSFSSEKEARRSSFCIEGSRRWSFCLERGDLRLEKALEEDNKAKEEEEKETSMVEKEAKNSVEVRNLMAMEEETDVTVNEDRNEEKMNVEREDRLAKSYASMQKEAEESGGVTGGLPDCLLLMMYEPKLSMEVSKETWVCSTDFLRWRPHHSQYRPRQPSTGGKVGDQGGERTELAKCKEDTKVKDIEEKKDENSENKQLVAPVESAPKPPLPPPRPVLTASSTEKKSKGNNALMPPPAPPYGPFVLTRCKSEPMRSSARLIPDACFWKDRHRPLGAAGIGF